MKRLSVLVVVLALLAVMVSSVSAEVNQDPPTNPDVSVEAVSTAEDVVVSPPIVVEGLKATPILF